MVDAIPLKFDFDGVTPSALAEFTSSNTVSVTNGGTGVSSLSVFGQSLSATNVSAASVSATTINSPTFTGNLTGNLTGNVTGNVDGTTVTALGTIPLGTAHVVTTSVSAVQVSATTSMVVSGCPIPAPFGYVQCDGASTNTTDAVNFASGATTTNIVSNNDDISWDDTLNVFHVSSTGIYELMSNLIVDAGSQNDILTITSRKNNADVMAIAPRIYGNVGPVERTFHNVLTAASGDNITIETSMGGSKTVHLEIGSTMTLKRLL